MTVSVHRLRREASLRNDTVPRSEMGATGWAERVAKEPGPAS